MGLSDIHKRQHLNKDYLLLVHSFNRIGEDFPGFYYDVPTRKSEYIEIPMIGYYTLDIDKGVVPL